MGLRSGALSYEAVHTLPRIALLPVRAPPPRHAGLHDVPPAYRRDTGDWVRVVLRIPNAFPQTSGQGAALVFGIIPVILWGV